MNAASTTSKPRRPGERASFYVWTVLALAVAVAVVVLSWHAHGGTPDPTDTAGAHRLGTATVVIDSAILVFREGLETILVLAAITASFLGANRAYRRPVAAGSGLALGRECSPGSASSGSSAASTARSSRSRPRPASQR